MARDPRYSRIKEAARLQDALTNYHNYLQSQLTAEPISGTPGNREAQVDLYAIPFYYTVPSGMKIREQADETAWGNYQTHFTNRTTLTAPSAENIVDIRNYKLPRVSVYTGYNNTGAYRESQITSLKYIHYGGKTRTIPFGPHDTTTPKEAINTAYETIRNAIISAGGTPLPKVYLIPEKK